MNQVANRWAAFLQNAGVKRRIVAASIVRISIGCLTLIYYTLHVAQRNAMWGSTGVVTWHDTVAILRTVNGWTLYQYAKNQVGFELIFWTGLVVTIACTLGFGLKITSFLFVVFTWSLYERNYYAIDGGENLLIIIAIYLLFADTSAISLDRELRWVHLDSQWVTGLLHNFAIMACLIQLAILYFISDFVKIQGHTWSNGTAIYYILRTDEFALPGYTDALIRSDIFVTLSTYLTIVFEAMYPWAIWHPKLKYVVFVGVVLLHGGIAVFMGLVWFSLTMISIDVLFFEDNELLALGTWFSRSWAWLHRSLRPSVIGKAAA